MTLKQQVFNAFRDRLNQRIQHLETTLAGLKESAANETKSTAGDKHETALAMLQIEQANTGRQLSELLLQKDAFEKINPNARTSTVVTGSLIKTNQGYLFLSVALGKMMIEGIEVIALSSQSPLGRLLVGQAIGCQITMPGKIYLVEEIM